MSHRTRLVAYALMCVGGLCACTLFLAGVVDDFVCGLGLSLAAVSAVPLFREARYRTDAAYARRTDATEGDERIQLIASKAADTAFRLCTVTQALACLVLRLAGAEAVASTLSIVVAAELCAYLVSYLVWSRRY